MALTNQDIASIASILDSKLEPIKIDINNIKKNVSDIEKRIAFLEITVESIDKKVDKLMQWTLADKEGVDYSTKH